jgi:uncharacterized protein YqgV (UPF0045/DUF77 family)
MTRLRLEFTVEPFREGGPGPHVLAAVQAVRDAGLVPEDGPFGTSVEGEADHIHALLGPLSAAATAAGATGLRASVQPAFEIAEGAHELLRTIRPIVHALGGTFIDASRIRPTDVPLDWNGQRIGGVRPAASNGSDLTGALEVAIAEVEALVGGRLGALSRSDKQRAASLLSERGVFHLRNAVDEVADAMNVSRATIYNYLAAAKRDL